MSIEDKKEKYLALAHAVQTGVAYIMQIDASETTPKHLRVGVNMAMCQHSGLVTLLLKKGIITEDEYYDNLIEMLEKEVENYKQELSRHFGANIELR